MRIPNSGTAARGAALAALVLSAACTDRNPAAPVPAGREARTQIDCTVSVDDGAMRCGAPAAAGGGAQSVILGGQGTFVRLESANAGYDAGSGQFSVDVTVQNLLWQRMGTPDGATATGVRVFFDQPPTATDGGGEVTVANADGEGTFTRAAQPYFTYPQILEPRGASQPRTWRFAMPASVHRFRFTVYVHTELPAEQGALRWAHESGYATRFQVPFDAVWGASRGHVFAVGWKWIMGLDSAGFAPMVEAPAPLYDVWGASRSEVYAAGDSGVVMRYDGNRWSVARAPTAQHQISGLWTDGGDLWAVGRHRATPTGDVDGLILRSGDDGATWTQTLSSGPGKRYLRDVFRVGSSVFVAGFEDPATAGAGFRAGVLLRSTDGGATWADSVFAGGRGITFYSVWMDGLGDVYVGGEMVDSAGARRTLLMHSTDAGATWSTSTPFTGNVQSLWRVPGGRLYAAGSGRILVNDGGTWSEFHGGPCVGFSAGFLGIWGSAENDLHVVAPSDFSWRYDGTCWRSTAPGKDWSEQLNAVSAAGDEGFAVAVGSTPTYDSQTYAYRFNRGVLRVTYGGSDWGEEYQPEFASDLRDVWTAGLALSVAAGWRVNDDGARGGLLLRRTSGGWADVTPAAAQDVPLTGVWGAGSEVHAFGVRAGASPSLVAYRSTGAGGAGTWAETAIPYTGAGTPHVTDAWGSAGALHVTGYGEVATAQDTTYESFTLRYDGTAWHLEVNTGDGAQLTGVWSTGSTVFVSGHRPAGTRWAGFVRRSGDGGRTWVETALPAASGDGRVEGIWGASAAVLYAAGGGGVIHVFDGVDWTPVLGADRPALLGVGGTAARNVYAVGRSGAVYHGIR